MRYESVIDDVPEYRGFMTVDELNESSRMLAQQHPDDVDLFKIGSSRRGDPIYALKVGEGALKAVLIGFPHPNEPIGSLTIEYLSKRLVEDDLLREELNFTWYFVKVSDVDGARLNEGWFKGKYDNLTHMLNFYRTPSSKQVEWTFPIEYKTLKWDGIPPETRSIMNLIDLVKPNFVFTLHNSAFGGVYFYVSDPCPRL
ncbi:MAG: M14 family zinc carboxypeptidase, partial [Candidatus Bathyarchaeia archaeon]